MTFETLGLIKPLLGALKKCGYITPTPIQERAIPVALAKHDTFATAQTGTGKTAAFALPILQRLSTKKRKSYTNEEGEDYKLIRALIITPTRELAFQIDEEIKTYAINLPITCFTAVGGRNLEAQKRAIHAEDTDILIATPGRLMELVHKEGLRLSEVEIFVLDEADRMLDMGFVKEIKQIHPLLPKRHQTMLFSATYTEKVRKISKLILHKPEFIETARKNSASDTISQVIYEVDEKRKPEMLSYLIGSKNYQHVLVFTRTKDKADELAKHLELDGLKCGVIHGDIAQPKRLKTLEAFKTSKLRVLVATDVASRGLDIEKLPQVVNYELPDVLEDYVHRIGRTGRAGLVGEAITLLSIDDKEHMKRIEKVIQYKIERITLEGFEPDPKIRRTDEEHALKRMTDKTDYSKPRKKKRPSSNATTKHRKMTKRGRKT
jgi:ATP-dependent RNA helicase RhlE